MGNTSMAKCIFPQYNLETITQGINNLNIVTKSGDWNTITSYQVIMKRNLTNDIYVLTIPTVKNNSIIASAPL